MSIFRLVFFPAAALLVFLFLFSCSRPKPGGNSVENSGVFFTALDGEKNANPENGAGEAGGMESSGVSGSGSEFATKLSAVIIKADLPGALAEKIQSALAEDPSFIVDLLRCLENSRNLRELVDKRHPLPQDYVPSDMVTLSEGSYRLGRAGLELRRDAAAALEEMAAAALADGVVLTVSSAYRSYKYQATVYNRNVEEMGQAAADRESARPGHSQHQLGLVVDFDPIHDSFAETEAGKWVAKNASLFGWSLSYPNDYEKVTGYRWESWHYRFVGTDLAAFIDNYFDGIQQYALRFLHEWALYENG